jgi:hypothetical protein
MAMQLTAASSPNCARRLIVGRELFKPFLNPVRKNPPNFHHTNANKWGLSLRCFMRAENRLFLTTVVVLSSGSKTGEAFQLPGRRPPRNRKQSTRNKVDASMP